MPSPPRRPTLPGPAMARAYPAARCPRSRRGRRLRSGSSRSVICTAISRRRAARCARPARSTNRSRWIGGELVVVQTGDILDRGDDEQAILDLLFRIEAEAKAAGGALVLLLGNHELMNARATSAMSPRRDERLRRRAGPRHDPLERGPRARAQAGRGARARRIYAKKLAQHNVSRDRRRHGVLARRRARRVDDPGRRGQSRVAVLARRPERRDPGRAARATSTTCPVWTRAVVATRSTAGPSRMR